MVADKFIKSGSPTPTPPSPAVQAISSPSTNPTTALAKPVCRHNAPSTHVENTSCRLVDVLR